MRLNILILNRAGGAPTAAEVGTAPITQADRERLAAEKAAAEQTASLIRDDLHELAELVHSTGLSYAQQLPLSDDEKEFLDRQEKGLIQAQLELEKALSVHSHMLRVAVYRSVRELFWCGANIARFAPPLEPTERALALKQEDRRKQEARLRGKASGASRQAKAAAGWQKAVLRLAQQSRATNPTLSQDSVASLIEHDWKDSNPSLPSRQTLVQFIRKCEGDARLQRRNAGRKRSLT